MDKTRFIVNPQLDAEGFAMADAKCRGCRPEDMCPRSGHCERYDSPLRYSPTVATDLMPSNPPGWREIDGVPLPHIKWTSPKYYDYEVSNACPRVDACATLHASECGCDVVLNAGRAC